MEVLVRRLVCAAVAVLVLASGACSGAGAQQLDPGLAPRGTTMTTTKPTRQDLTNQVSLSGKVTINPIFGLVAPVAGQIRYLNVTTSATTPTKPTKVANIWAGNKATKVEIPAGATLAGRLVDDGSKVVAGMPIVSAKYVGYGIVADIDGAEAYQISDGLTASVRAQITKGPGPFACTVLGTIAALPGGTVPAPPANPAPDPNPTGPPVGKVPTDGQPPAQSDPTGMRLVCTPPADVKLINGATATLQVVTAQAANVLVLPVEAVAGSQGKGQVDVVKADGSRETRDVVLGLSDGRVVEIKSGLTGEENIAVPGPNLPPAQGQDQPGFK
jgi:hypothetical protein